MSLWGRIKNAFEVFGVLIGVLVVGCWIIAPCVPNTRQPQHDDPPFQFKLTPDLGVLSHDLLFAHGCPRPLTDVNLTITTTTEDGKQVKITRFWGTWAPYEIKKVNIAATELLEAVAFTGTGSYDNRSYRLDALWPYIQEGRKKR